MLDLVIQFVICVAVIILVSKLLPAPPPPVPPTEAVRELEPQTHYIESTQFGCQIRDLVPSDLSQTRQDYNVLLIGDCRSGKSLIIEMLQDYLHPDEHHNHRYQPTQSVRCIEIGIPETEHLVRFIDAPRLGNSQHENDEAILDSIIAYLRQSSSLSSLPSSSIVPLHSIVFVFSANGGTLSAGNALPVKRMIASVLRRFERSVCDNFNFVFTQAGPLFGPDDFATSIRSIFENECFRDVNFCFQTNCFFVDRDEWPAVRSQTQLFGLMRRVIRAEPHPIQRTILLDIVRRLLRLIAPSVIEVYRIFQFPGSITTVHGDQPAMTTTQRENECKKIQKLCAQLALIPECNACTSCDDFLFMQAELLRRLSIDTNREDDANRTNNQARTSQYSTILDLHLEAIRVHREAMRIGIESYLKLMDLVKIIEKLCELPFAGSLFAHIFGHRTIQRRALNNPSQTY